jgi:hypothetical protein
MKTVEWYGCVKCQKSHYKDIQPELYKAHIGFQDKHSIQDKLFLEDEHAQKYINEIRLVSGHCDANKEQACKLEMDTDCVFCKEFQVN